MSLINDYTFQAMTDERERDFARLVEHNRKFRAALSGRESWWRRLLARRERRISIATQRATPEFGRAWNGDAPAPGRALSATRSGVRARWHDSAYGSRARSAASVRTDQLSGARSSVPSSATRWTKSSTTAVGL